MSPSRMHSGLAPTVASHISATNDAHDRTISAGEHSMSTTPWWRCGSSGCLGVCETAMCCSQSRRTAMRLPMAWSRKCVISSGLMYFAHCWNLIQEIQSQLQSAVSNTKLVTLWPRSAHHSHEREPYAEASLQVLHSGPEFVWVLWLLVPLPNLLID